MAIQIISSNYNDICCLKHGTWVANELISRLDEEARKLPEHMSNNSIRSHMEICDIFMDELEYYASISRNLNNLKIFRSSIIALKKICCLFV